MCSENKILYSIIVPIFNKEQYLERCINSVINQTLSRWELVLVDDGSTDNSILICKKYANNKNIKLIISEKNEGQLPSRLKGVTSCSGDYVLFLDSDDTYNKNALLLVDNCLRENRSDLVSFNPNLINGESYKNIELFIERKAIIGTSNILSEYLYQRIYGYSCFFAIKKEIAAESFKQIENFNYLRYTEDLLFMHSVFLRSNNCVQIPNKLYNYYVVSNSASTISNVKKHEDRFICYDYIYGNSEVNRLVTDDVKKQIMFAIISYVRELCFLNKTEVKDKLKIVRNSNIFVYYKKKIKGLDRITSIMIKLLSLKMYCVLIAVVKRYYKNHEKNN